ncbi:phosphopantetheine-binding protein, partial [Streptomyces sp. NPDC127068]|uniref:acyl carrier protein n=1 Tax=Streptomyces sp. NPDC127068 TaxID=3347127 RepID=UPI00364895AB
MEDQTEPTHALMTRTLAGMPSAHDRNQALRDLVCEQTAGLLEVDPATIDPGRAYRDYGYNSLAAVELTGRLGKATGLTLPLTLLFDHPTPAAVAARLLALLGFEAEDTAPHSAPAAGAARAARAEAAEPDDDPVVIVGMGCRFPGGVVSAEGLWDVVVSGRDVVGG